MNFNAARLLSFFAGLALFGSSTREALAAGAVTPFTVLEAEAGNLAGGATIRAFTPGSPVPFAPTLELEASGMGYVWLTNLNQSVSWTNPVANANAVLVRSSIPDAPNGGGIIATINLYVDGIFRQSITLSSGQSWNYRNSTTTPDDPNGGGTSWHFYNEDRAFIIGVPIAAGSTIKLQKDATNSAAFYALDSIDLESVPSPRTQPANSLSITSGPYNADPTFTTDSKTGIQNCINDARTQGKTVWIPQGKYMVNSLASGGLDLTGVTIEGAGMWFSTIYRKVPLPPTGTWRSHIHLGTNSILRDISIDSNATYRGNGGAGGDDYGIDSSGNNWLVERIWVQHCDANWMSGSFGTIRDSRVSDSWADGINLNNGNSPDNSKLGISLTASNNFVRGSGDDGLATYSDSGASGTNPQMQNTRILNNTSVATYWANGIRIGGTNVIVQGNMVDSVSANNGMEVSVFGDSGRPLDYALVSGNVLLRGGGWNGTDRHGMHVGSPGGTSTFPNAYTRATITNNVIQLALRDGLKIGTTSETLTVSHNVIDHAAQGGVHIQTGVTGTGIFEYNLVTNLNAGKLQYQNESPTTFLTTHLSNSWTVVGPLIKSDTTTMNTAADWSGTTPSAGNTGQFDNTISAANAANLTLGGNVILDGLIFFSNMNGPVTVAPGNTITVATSAGISMVVANFDVTLNCLLSASAFNITGGRRLTLGGGSTAFLSGTSTGQGTLLLSSASAKSFAANGNPSVNMGNPATGTGGLVVSNNCTMTDSGSFIIGNSGNGVVTLNSSTAVFNTTGSAGVIMVGRNSGSTTSGRLKLIDGSLSTAASTTGAGIIVGCQLNNAAARGVLDIQGGTLTLPQILDIGGAMSAGSGSVTMSGGMATVGTISFGGANGTVGSANSTGGTGSLTMTGGTLYVGAGGITNVGTGTFSSVRTLSGGTMGATANWSSALPITLATTSGNITFHAADAAAVGRNISLSGPLSGPGGLIKSGAGTLTLSGANTYTGGTTINAGLLILSTTNNFSMAYTNNGGHLNFRRASVGSSLPASSFSFGNSGPRLTFDLADLGASLTPLITNSGNLTMNGNVVVNVSNAPVSGTSVLFSYAGTRSGSGNFVAGTIPFGASIIDDSAGRKVSLAYLPGTPPVITNLNYSSGSIGFSGTNGAPFLTYRILSSTNVAAPIPNWVPVWTNSFDASGNFSVTLPTSPAMPNLFYRLTMP